MFSTIAYKSWNYRKCDSAITIHENADFFAIFRHIIIFVSIWADR